MYCGLVSVLSDMRMVWPDRTGRRCRTGVGSTPGFPDPAAFAQTCWRPNASPTSSSAYWRSS